jgi:hypothetical protein
MPTKNPRINIVLEKPLYGRIQHLANMAGLSLSLQARDLIIQALELEEDAALTGFADKREKTFAKSRALKHEEVW